GFSATTLKSAIFSSQGSALTGTGFASNVSGDLYWNDGTGNQVRITASGAVNTGGTGSISGMDATSAVTYSTVTKVYTFTQSATFPAKIAVGDVQILPTVSGASNAITITNPNTVSYSLTLPTGLPAANALLYSSNVGALAFVAAPSTTTSVLQSTSGGV